MRLQEVHHVRDTPLSEPPRGPHGLRGSLGVHPGLLRNVGCRQIEVCFDPISKSEGERSRPKRHAAVPGLQAAERTKACPFLCRLFKVWAKEELLGETQRRREPID